jgi:pimeloyl-ACP methyl ester carboxylesterase
VKNALAARSSARKSRVRYVVLACVIICGLWIVVGFLATIPVTGNHSYWRQFRGWPKDFGLTAEDVSFLSQDGIPLKGWYIRAQGVSQGTVIIAHGINGNRSDMLSRAALLVRHNYSTLLVDLRDHGQSGGSYAGPGFIESRDVLGALNYLKSHGQTGPFAAMGHSYGGVAALYAAAQSPDVEAVIADSAFISFEDMVHRSTILLSRDPERSFWERLGLRLAGFRVVEWFVRPVYYLRTGVWLNARKTDTLVPISLIGTRPILFISGEKDEICPPQNAKLMFQAARSPEKRLLVVPKAGHDTTYQTDPQLYESTVIRFLEDAFRNLRSGEQVRSSNLSGALLQFEKPNDGGGVANCNSAPSSFTMHREAYCAEAPAARSAIFASTKFRIKRRLRSANASLSARQVSKSTPTP